jgi:hypothetical protein
MEPPAPGRSIRLALVAFGLLALLGVVAFASRSGLGHQSQAAPTPGYVSYAFTAFLIVFVLMIPVAAYGFLLQAREGEVARKSYRQRTLESIGMLFFFGALAFVVVYLKRHHHHFLLPHVRGLKSGKKALQAGHGHRAVVEPHFEYTVLWIALAVIAVGGGWLFYMWRTRKKRTAVPLEREQTVAEDFASSIGDAIDDLESEPDARRAVIAAYARMERGLGGAGLARKPFEAPLEYLQRVLLELQAGAQPVGRLTDLFERAKFSRDDVSADAKDEAIECLLAISGDLRTAQ